MSVLLLGLLAIYLLISLLIARYTQILGEFVVALAIMGVAVVLIFHYLL